MAQSQSWRSVESSVFGYYKHTVLARNAKMVVLALHLSHVSEVPAMIRVAAHYLFSGR